MTCGVQLATQPGVLMLGMVNGELVGYIGCQIEDPGPPEPKGKLKEGSVVPWLSSAMAIPR